MTTLEHLFISINFCCTPLKMYVHLTLIELNEADLHFKKADCAHTHGQQIKTRQNELKKTFVHEPVDISDVISHHLQFRHKQKLILTMATADLYSSQFYRMLFLDGMKVKPKITSKCQIAVQQRWFYSDHNCPPFVILNTSLSTGYKIWDFYPFLQRTRTERYRQRKLQSPIQCGLEMERKKPGENQWKAG